jgi:hypothetical protein
MDGKGRRYLIEPKTESSGSSDSHSEKAEVRTESLLSKSINLRKIVLRSKQMLIWESNRFKETPVSKNQLK